MNSQNAQYRSVIPILRRLPAEPERTFWEKATILHAQHHRSKDKKSRKNLSRDIYDVCQMASNESGKRALDDLDLLERVAEWKNKWFYTRWKKLDAAKPGTLRLVPPDYRIPELKSDYTRMKEMFYETPPDFNALLEKLRIIEEKVNSKK